MKKPHIYSNVILKLISSHSYNCSKELENKINKNIRDSLGKSLSMVQQISHHYESSNNDNDRKL